MHPRLPPSQITFSGPDFTGPALRAILDCCASYPGIKNLCLYGCSVGDEVGASMAAQWVMRWVCAVAVGPRPCPYPSIMPNCPYPSVPSLLGHSRSAVAAVAAIAIRICHPCHAIVLLPFVTRAMPWCYCHLSPVPCHAMVLLPFVTSVMPCHGATAILWL